MYEQVLDPVSESLFAGSLFAVLATRPPSSRWLGGREGDLLRRVPGWSLGLLAIMCVLVYLQTNVLEWMVVEVEQ